MNVFLNSNNGFRWCIYVHIFLFGVVNQIMSFGFQLRSCFYSIIFCAVHLITLCHLKCVCAYFADALPFGGTNTIDMKDPEEERMKERKREALEALQKWAVIKFCYGSKIWVLLIHNFKPLHPAPNVWFVHSLQQSIRWTDRGHASVSVRLCQARRPVGRWNSPRTA